MWPVLFRIPLPGWDLPLIGKVGAIPIYSYGVMLGLSLVVGWYLTLGLAEKDGLPRETMANNYVITAISAVLAARVLYILTNLNEFQSFADVFSFNRGGLVAYGGFLGGFFGSLLYLRTKGIRLMPWADVAVPSLASGLAITRIGCYLFGCDFGKPLAENAPAWLKTAGTFPRWEAGLLPSAGSPAWLQHVNTGRLENTALASLPVHPTQLYESVLGLTLLALLLWVRKRQRFRGQVFFVFTFAYGVGRFMLEILRDDAERGSVPGSLPQHIMIPLCLALFAAAFAVAISRVIANPPTRQLVRVLAFIPAPVVFFTMRPASFAPSALMQLSTSQFIGLASGLAVAAAYLVMDRAADAHPYAAMDLGLPDEEEDLVEDEEADDSDVDGAGADDDATASAEESTAAGTESSADEDSDDAASDEEPSSAHEDAEEEAAPSEVVDIPVRGDSTPPPTGDDAEEEEPAGEIEIGQTSDKEASDTPAAAAPKLATPKAAAKAKTTKRRPKKKRRRKS